LGLEELIRDAKECYESDEDHCHLILDEIFENFTIFTKSISFSLKSY